MEKLLPVLRGVQSTQGLSDPLIKIIQVKDIQMVARSGCYIIRRGLLLLRRSRNWRTDHYWLHKKV